MTEKLFETSRDGIVTVDLSGNILEANPAYQQMLGYSLDELKRLTYQELTPEIWRGMEAAIVETQILPRGESAEYEKEYIRKDGSVFPISLRTWTVTDDDGRIIGMRAFVRDITERKRAEEALRQREAWLKGQGEALEAAVNGAPLHVALGALTRTANEAFGSDTRAAFYIARGDALYHVVGMGEDYAGMVDGFKIGPESLACGLATHTGEAVITPDVTEDPLWEPWQWLAEAFHYRGCWSFPIHSAEGKFIGTLTIYWPQPREAETRDREFAQMLTRTASVVISHHVESEARREAERALREADRRKDEFLAILAHELRNPLATIHNAMHVLVRNEEPKGPERRLLDMAHRQLAHLVRLVEDLLEVSRISRGKIDLRNEYIALSSSLTAALENCQPLIDRKGHRVALTISDEPLWVLGDPVRLTQIAANLINNAAKYTPPGGTIEIEAARDGDEAVLRIRDNGVGVGPDMMADIFDLFAQGQGQIRLSEGGLGIGLALVRKLLELHGGRIEARSEGVGRGSEFTVRLPLAKEPAAVTAPVERTTGGEKLARALVIDDDRDVADSFGMLLENLGATVTKAYDGAAGVEMIDAFKPDLIFLDLGMPDMDGYETARRIRHATRDHSFLLVALTGWGQEEDRRRAKEAGFDLHLTKPAPIDVVEELLQRIGSACLD